MPAEITGEALEGVVRGVGRLLIEVIFEVVIRGTGWLICRIFRQHVDPEGGWATCVGITFWLAIGVAAYEIQRRF